MAEAGVRWIGLPVEVVRATDVKYADDARIDFRMYVHRTLEANQAVGGRYNAPGEFGALYAASDTETAWAEISARFAREGIPGLPPRMGLLGLVIRAGWLVDLTDAEMREQWQVELPTLVAPELTPEQQAANHALGRAVRPLADVLACPSARTAGSNYAIFPQRERSELQLAFQFARTTDVPVHLRQAAQEEW